MLRFLLTIVLLLLKSYRTEAQIQRTLCSQSPSMAFNVTQIGGVWWEVARNPAKIDLACVRVTLTEIQPENLLQIATTYAISNIYLWKNQTMYANVSLKNTSVNGYNISYTNGITTTENIVYKLLGTDYNNYALICGYTNFNNSETSFGIILTRDRYPNITRLLDLEDAASLKYSDFAFGTMPLVTQSPKCYNAGVGTPYSMSTSIFALLYIILNMLM